MAKSKMKDIQAQLERATGKKSAGPAATVITSRAKADVPKSREGKVHIGAFLDAAHKTSLRMVQLKTDKDFQSILHEALNEAYRRYDVPVVG